MTDQTLALISENELVVSYAYVIDALGLLEAQAIPILGWEGRLRRSDGTIGHSSNHQGAGTQGLALAEAYRWVRHTIHASQKEYDRQPEKPDAELLFCVTVGDRGTVS